MNGTNIRTECDYSMKAVTPAGSHFPPLINRRIYPVVVSFRALCDTIV